MKKIIPLLLGLVCCLSCLFACASEDEAQNNNNNNEKPSYGNAAVYAPGDYVQIVYGTDEDRVGASILREYVDKILGENGQAVVTTSYAMNASHEIVIGLKDESRPATVTAYNLLERLDRESYFTVRYVIYAENNTVAVAYDHVEASPIQAIEYIIDDFIKNYVDGKQYLAFGKGIIHSGNIELIPIQEEIDAELMSEQWAKFESVMGKDLADAVRTLYSLYDENMIDWFANLYDPGIGAFYAASSGRDGKEFGPDVENGVQILSFIQSSGMLDEILKGEKLEWSKLLPAEMRAQMIYFAKSLQDTNGYFYHPQWAKNTIDSNIIRRSRDLGRSTSILSSLGSAPAYNAPNGTKGDGITADEFWELEGVGSKPYTYDKSPIYGESSVTGNLGQSADVAVSKIVLAADDSSNTAYLKSHTAFIDYVLDVVIPGVRKNPYSGGSEIGESQSQVNVADKALGPYEYQSEDGSRYEEYDGMTLRQILVYEMNKIINPETGFWGDVPEGRKGTEFLYTNGFMKSMAMYNGLKMPYPEEYAAIAARGLMNALLSDEPSENNICEVYNVWVSICRLNENLQYIDNVEVRNEVKQIVSEALAESAADAIINSYNKVKGYKKYDGGFSHYYTKGTASHSNMPVATGKNQSDVDATCIGTTGLVSQIRIALGCSDIMPDIYTASDWMRFYEILTELTPVIKYDEEATVSGPAIYTFDDDDVSGLSINTSNKIVKEGNDAKLCITKTGTASGASLGVPANSTNPLANVTVFEADVKYANITALSETQITLGTKSTDALSYSPILILLQFSGTADGSKIFYSDYQNGNGNGQKIDTGAVIGQWFKIRIEYYGDGENVPFYYKTYINNKLIYVSTAIYSQNIVSGKTSLPTANAITRMNYTMNMRFLGEFYFDNVSLVQKYDDKAKDDPDYNFEPTDPTPDIDINLPPETEFGPLMEFDGMPASNRITVSSTNVQNAHTIVSADSGNKVLHLLKPGSPNDYSSSYNFTVKTTAKDDNPTLAVFTADILVADVSSISDIQITAKTTESTGSNASPFIIFLTPKGMDEGSALKYNHFGPKGANPAINKEVDATVGKWFRLRIEYRVTATDSNGVPTAIEYKTFINDSLVYTSNSVYGEKLTANGGEIPLPSVESIFGITLSFNSKLCGNFYIDNVGFIKCAGDFVMPEAQTEVGTDSSLEPGNKPDAPHEHKFVDGKCACGAVDPDYKPVDPDAPHEHKFVDGKCECGETDPNYKPFAGVVDFESDYSAYVTFSTNDGFKETNTAAVVSEGDNKVLFIHKAGKDEPGKFGGGATLNIKTTKTEANAKIMVLEFDLKLANITGSYDTQILMYHNGLSGAKNSPFLIPLPRVENDWAHITITYEVTASNDGGTPSAIKYCVYKNGVLQSSSTEVYGSEIKNGKVALPKASEATNIAIGLNNSFLGDAYFDNVSLALLESFEVEVPHEHKFVDGKCECGTVDPGYTPDESEHILTFDEMPESSAIFVNNAYKESTYGIETLASGNSVFVVDKKCDDTFGCSFTMTVFPIEEKADAKKAVFTADVCVDELVGVSQIQISARTTAGTSSNVSPFLVYFTPKGTSNGSALSYHSMNGDVECGAAVGEWFRIKVEYSVTAHGDDDKPSAIETKVYINDLLIETNTVPYGEKLAVNGGTAALPEAYEIKGVTLSFNSKLVGKCYADNVGVYLCDEFVMPEVETEYRPHTHEFVDGKCACGAVDPDYNVSDKKGVVTFDEMPAKSVLSISSPGITDENIVGTNTWEIATVDEENVLHIVKGATGQDADGKLLNYTCGVSLTAPVTNASDKANVLIFEFDVKYVSVTASDDLQITINSVNTSPFVCLYRPIAKGEDMIIRNNGTETSAKVGDWVHIRVEYRITAEDDAGNPTAYEVKYFVNEEAPVVTTAVRDGKSIFSYSAISSVSLSFNRANLGEYYLDNLSCRLDYVEPAAE